MNINLNEKQTDLLVSFLEDLLDQYKNDGCNDWNFPENWTLEDKLEVLPNHNGLSAVTNVSVLEHLISKLKDRNQSFDIAKSTTEKNI